MVDIDATTFKQEQDGAFTISMDKKPVRLVKESDLLAVKGSSEAKLNEWNTERATLTSKVEESTKAQETVRQELLKEQALKEQLATKYKDYDTLTSRVGELTKELDTHKTSLQKHQEELTKRIKAQLLTSGAMEESLRDKNLDQLRNLEEAARIFGSKGKGANYDGGGGGGNPNPETPFERAKRVVATQEEKQGRPVKVAGK